MKIGIYTLIIESHFKRIPGIDFDFGYGNGYVLLPNGHPFYEVNYDDINYVYVHGGLTFSDYFDCNNFLKWIKNKEICGDVTLENYKKFDKFWMIGFDTSHYNDNEQNCSKEYVIKETESLLNQCLGDSIDGILTYKRKQKLLDRKQKLLNINRI